MNSPLVSVIIPSYNHENYVQETINSIINQTYKNIELIIIDDGSKDKTWQKISEMKSLCEKRFVRVHFETKENEGTCNTLNKLISLAKGEFIYIIASDDVAKPQAIEKEASFLQKNPDYVLVVGDDEIINMSSQRIGWDVVRNSVDLSKSVYQTYGQLLQKDNFNFSSTKFGKYETLVSGNYIPNGYMVKRKALEQTGGFVPQAPLEDWWLHLQLSKIGKYKYIDEVLFSYRWHNNNTMKRADYMREITYKTQLYERKKIASLKDKKWLKLFKKNMNKIEMKFNFLNIIKYYHLRNLEIKQQVLELFGIKIVMKTCYL